MLLSMNRRPLPAPTMTKSNMKCKGTGKAEMTERKQKKSYQAVLMKMSDTEMLLSGEQAAGKHALLLVDTRAEGVNLKMAMLRHEHQSALRHTAVGTNRELRNGCQSFIILNRRAWPKTVGVC